MQPLPFYIKKLTEQATLPQKGSSRAAGYDLYAHLDAVVPAKGKQIIKTGLAFAVPTGNYARIAPRSGLAWKNFIDVGAGVIDEDYRGEVGVILYNHSEQDFVVKPGDRVAQVIIEKISETQVQEVQELDDTNRGAGGFGSTGVSAKIEEKKDSVKRNFDQQEQSSIENQQQIEKQYDWKEEAIVALHNLSQQQLIDVELKRKIGTLVLEQNNEEVLTIIKKNADDKQQLKTQLLKLLLQ